MKSSTSPSKRRLSWKRRSWLWRARLDRAARGRAALPALFVGSIIESSLLPWPIEFPLLAYMLRGRREVVLSTLVVALGSAVGCLLSYWAGRAAFALVFEFFETRPALLSALDAAQSSIDRQGALAAGLAMLSPVPVQITSFAAGAAGMSPWVFFMAALLGRLARYGAMGVFLFVFGDRVLLGWRAMPGWLRRTITIGFLSLFLALSAWAIYGVIGA